MFAYEIFQKVETARPRGAGVERRGGRNCGTYRGWAWKIRAATNDKKEAESLIAGLGDDWKIEDNTQYISN